MSDYVAGTLFIVMGIASMLLSGQMIRQHQEFYDRHHWWPHPPLWYEQAVIVSVGFLSLAVGILVILMALIS